MSLLELKTQHNRTVQSKSLIRVLNERYEEFELSDSFHDDHTKNSEYFNALQLVKEFIVKTNKLTFKKLTNSNELHKTDKSILDMR